MMRVKFFAIKNSQKIKSSLTLRIFIFTVWPLSLALAFLSDQSIQALVIVDRIIPRAVARPVALFFKKFNTENLVDNIIYSSMHVIWLIVQLTLNS